jgi:hypothetical protein
MDGMNGPVGKLFRCAIYARKSSEHNLDLAFTSLDAQREACEAYILSQAAEGWRLLAKRYDDGGISGASLQRPALQALLADIRDRTVDIVVVYKVDRLTRSLADFAKLIDHHAGQPSSVRDRGRPSWTLSRHSGLRHGTLAVLAGMVCAASRQAKRPILSQVWSRMPR